MRAIWVIGLMGALLLGGAAQTLVLTNGDVNGDNGVDDADQLSVLFRFGQSCPGDCPEDLNGDHTIDDADLLIVNFNFGVQGAPAFAGTVQSPSGSFGRTIQLQLGDWVGGTRQVKVQLKPVGTENDPNVPIYEWTFTVGGTATQVQLTNLPAGVYTVRAREESGTRWLRTEGKIVTEVPWIFAVPTGANKVTVYWDGVPGATGYRVRWGTASGSYPSASGVLSGSARQYTVSGLVSERAYYFVVEAEWNGVWGPPSEEDSAVPHVGAIPWDTQDPNQIIPAVLQAIGEPVWQDVEILGPDELYYDQTGGVRRRVSPPVYFHPSGWITDELGNIFVASAPRDSQQGGCHPSGAYVQIRATTGSAIAARGQFWVPPTSGVYRGMSVDGETRRTTRDAPYIYYSIGQIIEGGVYYMRGDWGALQPDGTEAGAPNYERWIPYMKYAGKFYKGDPTPMVGNPKKSSNHIPYFGFSSMYGLILQIEFIPDVKKKHVETKVQAWEGAEDGYGDPFFTKPLVVPVPEVKDLPRRLEIRQTVSIAQNNLRNNYYCQRSDTYFGLWRNSFGQHVPVGVGSVPIGTGTDLDPVMLLRPNGSWVQWTSGLTSMVLRCPQGLGAANYDHYNEWGTQWYRGHIWITTSPCPP